MGFRIIPQTWMNASMEDDIKVRVQTSLDNFEI